MATTKITAFYDTNISSTNKEENNEKVGEMFVWKNNEIGILQFNIPSMSDISISSTKLRLFCEKSVAGVSVIAESFDVPVRLAGVTYNNFSRYLDKMILRSSDMYTFNSTSWEYENWIEFDITNLIFGNIGKNNFTLLIKTESGSQIRFRTIEFGKPPELVITYTDSVPFKPTIIYPNGEILQNSGIATFSWRYNASNSSGQAKYEVGWKMQSETTWKTSIVNSSNQYHQVDASLFTNGIVEWRVKTYNAKGMSSEYAEGKFSVVGKPSNPAIGEIKNNAITEIRWEANKAEETAAMLSIKKGGKVIFGSGKIAGGITDSYIPDLMLENGAYIALLKISNVYDMWSDEISKVFNINGLKPEKPAVIAINQHDFVHLDISGNAIFFYIYRSEGENYVPIAKVSRKQYDDYAVRSGVLYKYFVRAYTESFTDSDICDVSINYDGYYFSAVSDMSKRVHMISHDSELYIPIRETFSSLSCLINYHGREFPVRERGVYKELTVSIEFFLNYTDLKTFEKIIRVDNICCLRNNEMVFYCDIPSFTKKKVNLLEGYIINFTAQKIDYGEEVHFNI